jgi:hydrogenase maturation protease
MKKTLLIGYGNPDRQDDGLAWHILFQLAGRFDRPVNFDTGINFIDNHQSPDFLFSLQITPEMIDFIKDYDQVCFVDAHTGNIPAEIQLVNLKSKFQKSPFTHHMTPETCLSLHENIYHRTPEAVLVSVRGYEFGFTQGLSPQCEKLVAIAVGTIWSWLFSEGE